MLAIADWTFVKYRMGTSLELLEKDSGLYARQARDVKQLNPLSFLLLQQQCCLNLMGIDNIDDPSRLVALTARKCRYCAWISRPARFCWIE